MRPLIRILIVSFLLACLSLHAQVHLIHIGEKTGPLQFGMEQLKEAVDEKGYGIVEDISMPRKIRDAVILTGIAAENNEIGKELNRLNVPVPKAPEALLIKRIDRDGKPVLVITGADARGTMYALLEAAEQITCMPEDVDIFNSISDVEEKPFSSERSLSTYIKTGHVREGFWHDGAYWDALFKQLAFSRLNSYNIIFKIRAPVYTVFFDVEGWPQETVGGEAVPSDEQARNLKALQSIVRKAHDHGIHITLGIWNHVHNPEDAERLAPYTKEAIAKLVRLVPFDAFQFRMHWESGLPKEPETLRTFWGSVFDGINKSGRKMRIYPRAKGLPNLVIDVAVEKGMDFAIETKYMAEQMGMPFHPAHIQRQNQFDRRHGYADLLTYPKRYDILWRSWSWGSQKLLVWGDLNYARRWVRSTALYNDEGIFEVMQIEGAKPMAKGEVRCLADAHVYTDYEFQRYWCHNLMFGRIGYNPETPDEVFEREFRQRFGGRAGPVVMQALSEAGMILPRIIGSGMPDFQEARGVPEWGSGSGLRGKATLAAYAGKEPSDIQTFIGFEEAAQMLLAGEESARVWPQQTADWHRQTAESVLSLVEEAEQLIGSYRNKEFEATMTDLRILVGIAKFHSIRIKAALCYNLYVLLDQSGPALAQAVACESEAIAVYRQLVQTIGDFYRTDLDLSVSDTGHWRDELKLLEEAFEELKKLPVNNQSSIPSISPGSADDISPPIVRHDPVRSAEPGKAITIQAEITDSSGVKWARVKYRGLTQFQDYEILEMARVGDLFTATVSGEALDYVTEYNEETGALWDFMYLIEVMDNKGNGCIYPDLNETDPYVLVPLPHQTIEETGGKISYSRIRDKTYASQFHDRPRFEIVMPVNGDVFDSGVDVVLKMKHPWVDPDETITVYANGVEVQAEKRGDLEYIIRGLENGMYRLNAYLTKVGLVAWSNSVEIVVGETRGK